MKKNYYQKAIPDQRRLSKIIPIPKKVANPLWNNLQSLLVKQFKLIVHRIEKSTSSE
jgi:hypothetical protein